MVDLAKTKYLGFNQHHLTEMLAEREALDLSVSSVHRILARAGIAAPRQRRAPRHRRRRDRYPRAGMLLQIDGSRHDWLEGRGPYLSLLGGIDDATGVVPWASFHDQEHARGYFELLRMVVRRYGIPLATHWAMKSYPFGRTGDQAGCDASSNVVSLATPVPFELMT